MSNHEKKKRVSKGVMTGMCPTLTILKIKKKVCRPHTTVRIQKAIRFSLRFSLMKSAKYRMMDVP